MSLLTLLTLTLFKTLTFSLLEQVSVTWNNVLNISNTTTTCQVVVNPLITRYSQIHNQVYQSLAQLNASFVRFSPWVPYPRLGVGQLVPPSGKYLCSHLNGDSNNNNWTISLQCPLNSTINDVQFASFGTPRGYCGNYTLGDCNSNSSINVVEKYCLNKNSCTIPVNVETFNGDPCFGIQKSFAVQVTCDINYQYSNWDFSYLNPIVEDLFSAVNPKNENNKTVINFSTQPNWKYPSVTPEDYYSSVTDNPFDCSWAYSTYGSGNEINDEIAQSIGEYYGKLLAYYTKGGFIDIYGNNIKSNYFYNIDTYEILNEPEGEHTNTPQSYTLLYDYIIQGIWKYADPTHKMKFMGLALAFQNEWDWYNYFLNKSNHISSNIPIDYISFHFYSVPSSRTDPNTYNQIFNQGDMFVEEVKQIINIRNNLSPNTKLDIDELGVGLPNDNMQSPNPPDIYWNAAGAFFAYMFGRLSTLGVDIIGFSQLMGFPPMSKLQFPASPDGLPPQYASISLLDWNTGFGNAKYWTLYLLINHFKPGYEIIQTNYVNSNSSCYTKNYPTIDNCFFSQGFIDVETNTNKVLLLNKLNEQIMVKVNNLTNGTLFIADEISGFNQPRIQTVNQNYFYLGAFSVAVLYP